MKVALASVLVLMCGVVSGCLEPPKQPTEASVVETTTSTTPKPPVSLTPAPTAPTAKPAFGFTPTLDAVNGKQGKVDYNVKLPQVSGDNAGVRDRFNEGMRAALNDVVRGLDDPKLTKPVTIGDGQLAVRESSRVSFIGPHVVSGIAIFLTNSGGPYPSNRVATITINAGTAHPIMFDDVFPNQEPAREQLRKLARELGPPDRIRAAGDMKAEQFLHWLPVPGGLTFYVTVPHVAGDYVPVTVPWQRIHDLVGPGMQKVLSQ